MVSGIVVQLAITAVIAVIATYALKAMYLRGFIAGMQHEAKAWADAVMAVKPPNWQSLPIDGHEGWDREKIEGANKVYAGAFRVALDVIREEIAVNRMAALVKDFEEARAK